MKMGHVKTQKIYLSAECPVSTVYEVEVFIRRLKTDEVIAKALVTLDVPIGCTGEVWVNDRLKWSEEAT